MVIVLSAQPCEGRVDIKATTKGVVSQDLALSWGTSAA